MSEITLDINFRQALILKHGLEQMINSKEERLYLLIAKEEKTSEEAKEAYKLKRDIHDEMVAMTIVNLGLDKFHNYRREEVRNYAVNLPNLLKQAEINSRL